MDHQQTSKLLSLDTNPVQEWMVEDHTTAMVFVVSNLQTSVPCITLFAKRTYCMHEI